MALAEKKGILIPTRLATMHVAYMLTCFRQRVLAEPVTLAGRLVAGGFLEETRQHDAAEMVKADLCAMLELADRPYGISDPDWVAKIDPDLRPKVEGDGESGSSGRVTDPSEVKRGCKSQVSASEENRDDARAPRENSRQVKLGFSERSPFAGSRRPAPRGRPC